MYKFFLLYVIIFTTCSYGYSQTTIKLSLSETIALAQKNSIDYKIALNMVRSSYWNYENYKAGLLPKLSLSGSLPEYYSAINSITLPNGQVTFIGQSVANTAFRLNLSQRIGATGGDLNFGSSLNRLDNFGNTRTTNFISVPFTISYAQSNLFYNDIKWKKKIEPLKLKEAQRLCLENLENISYSTVSQYFSVLLASVQLKLDEQNLKNIDTLVEVTKARFEIGTAQLNDVLHAKVSWLNAKSSLANTTLAVKRAQQTLLKYLNIDKSTVIKLESPDSVWLFDIGPELAIDKAQQNRKYVIEFQRIRLEAERNVAQTKAETGPQINFNANIGVTQTGTSYDQAYTDLLRNQSVTIGFRIPLLDWGVNKSNRKRAEANLELENNFISQEQLSAEQEIYYQVSKWSIQKSQIEISKETRKVAQQRYEIAKQKYLLGSLNFTDFNNAQLERDRSVVNYLNNLQNYWSMFYLIRKLTLFDFQTGRDIDLEGLLLN